MTVVAFKKPVCNFFRVFPVLFCFCGECFFSVFFSLVVIGSLRVRALLLLSVSVLFLHSQPLLLR